MDEARDEGVALLMCIKLASGVDMFRGAQRLGPAAVEAFDHAIGLRSERFGRTMFDLEHRAGLVKGVATGRSAAGLFFISTAKRSVNSEPLSVRTPRMGAGKTRAKHSRKVRAVAAARRPWISRSTKRVARSMAT